jgi:hypothetical protein
MSEEKKEVVPIVIDADVFAPTPTNVLSYRGKEYRAFNVLQVPRSIRNKFATLDSQLKACADLDAQSDLLVEMIAAFVPGVPVEDLREEPWEPLLQVVLRLGNSVGTDGEARPTTGRGRSSKRRSTHS